MLLQPPLELCSAQPLGSHLSSGQPRDVSDRAPPLPPSLLAAGALEAAPRADFGFAIRHRAAHWGFRFAGRHRVAEGIRISLAKSAATSLSPVAFAGAACCRSAARPVEGARSRAAPFLFFRRCDESRCSRSWRCAVPRPLGAHLSLAAVAQHVRLLSPLPRSFFSAGALRLEAAYRAAGFSTDRCALLLPLHQPPPRCRGHRGSLAKGAATSLSPVAIAGAAVAAASLVL